MLKEHKTGTFVGFAEKRCVIGKINGNFYDCFFVGFMVF
jgi:hypothetical protein